MGTGQWEQAGVPRRTHGQGFRLQAARAAAGLEVGAAGGAATTLPSPPAQAARSLPQKSQSSVHRSSLTQEELRSPLRENIHPGESRERSWRLPGAGWGTIRHTAHLAGQHCRAAGLRGCRIAGLQGCRIAGLQCCMVAGLQGCRAAGSGLHTQQHCEPSLRALLTAALTGRCHCHHLPRTCGRQRPCPWHKGGFALSGIGRV